MMRRTTDPLCEVPSEMLSDAAQYSKRFCRLLYLEALNANYPRINSTEVCIKPVELESYELNKWGRLGALLFYLHLDLRDLAYVECLLFTDSESTITRSTDLTIPGLRYRNISSGLSASRKTKQCSEGPEDIVYC